MLKLIISLDHEKHLQQHTLYDYDTLTFTYTYIYIQFDSIIIRCR